MGRRNWRLSLAIGWGVAGAACLSDPEESGPTHVPQADGAESPSVVDEPAPPAGPTSTPAQDEPAPSLSPSSAAGATAAPASGPWIDVSALPEVEIPDIPARADWATKVRSARVPNWHVVRLDKSIPRSPHMLTSGLFASKKTARHWSKTRDLLPAANGTCFKVVWPRPERATGAPNVSDREPVLVPEPHLIHRGRWESFIGWVQGTRWIGLSDDGRELRLDITEAWFSAANDRLQKIAQREVTFARIEGGLEGFAMFGAREGERVHLMVVPLDDGGELVLGPPTPDPPPPKGSTERILNPPEFRMDYPCAWRRLSVASTQVVTVLRKKGRPESRKVGRFLVTEVDGTLRLEVAD